MTAICLDISNFLPAVRSQTLTVTIPFVAKLPMQRLALTGFALASNIEKKHILRHDSQLTEVICEWITAQETDETIKLSNSILQGCS